MCVCTHTHTHTYTYAWMLSRFSHIWHFRTPRPAAHARILCPALSPGVYPSSRICMSAESIQPCLTLNDPLDCGPPGSSVHGVLQARIPEWVAIPFSRGSSRPRNQTWVSCTADRFLTIWATGEALSSCTHTYGCVYIYRHVYVYI